ELDGKRGLIENALHHTHLAQRLLSSSPHLWLEAWCQVNLVAISVLQCDFEEAVTQCGPAMKASSECGSVWSAHACVGNLGFLHFSRGQFDKALEHFYRLVNTGRSNEQVLASSE